jgi:hypothetical protein
MLAQTLTTLVAIATCAAGAALNPATFAASDVIRKDFVILGGGASGTYAAIALKDKGKSFVVVEKGGRLGGHARTYYDPKSGKSVDFGLQIYLNDSVVTNFFDRLNTPYTAVSPAQFGSPFIHADFAKKVLMPNYSRGSLGQDYLDDLAKFNPGANDLTYLKTPVDPALTLTWPEYIEQTGLSNASAYAAFNRPAIPGRLREDLALYVFNDLNDVMIREGQQYGAIVNANRDNSQLYRNAQAELGSSVLYNSQIIDGSRANNNVRLVVNTPTGRKLIVAKQVIIAMPRILSNMQTLGLDSKEKALISQITGGQYYGGVVNNTGLLQTAAYPNRGVDTAWNVPDVPSVVTISPSPVDGFHYYWYTSLQATTRSVIESAVRDAISTLQTLTGAAKTTPNFVDYQDFTPLQLRVSADNINSGFYQKFNAMQGYKGTWYVSAFNVPGSSQIFKNTMDLLPQIIAAAGN